MAETRFGTFDDLLQLTEKELQAIVIRLKETILDIDPNAIEVVRLGDRAATYGLGPKKMIEGYSYILPHKKWVNLGFFRGALLDNKSGLLEGTGKNMRHVKIRSVEDANKEELKELIQAAFEERKKAFKK